MPARRFVTSACFAAPLLLLLATASHGAEPPSSSEPTPQSTDYVTLNAASSLIDDKSYRGFGISSIDSNIFVVDNALANIERLEDLRGFINFLSKQYNLVHHSSVVVNGPGIYNFVNERAYVSGDNNIVKFFNEELGKYENDPDKEIPAAMAPFLVKSLQDGLVGNESLRINISGIPEIASDAELKKLEVALSSSRSSPVDKKLFKILALQRLKILPENDFYFAWTKLKLAEEKRFSYATTSDRSSDIEEILRYLPPTQIIGAALQVRSDTRTTFVLPQITYGSVASGVDVEYQNVVSDSTSGGAAAIQFDLSPTRHLVSSQLERARNLIRQGKVKEAARWLRISADTFVESTQNLRIALRAQYTWMDSIGTSTRTGLKVSWLERLGGGSGVFPLVSVESVQLNPDHGSRNNLTRTGIALGWQDRVPQVVQDQEGSSKVNSKAGSKDSSEVSSLTPFHITRWKTQIGVEYDFKTSIDKGATTGLFVRYRCEPGQRTNQGLHSLYGNFTEFGLSLGVTPDKDGKKVGLISFRVAKVY